MTMKKKLLTTLSVVLILGMAAMGILAYLTDRDSQANVFTVGDVKIELHEVFDQGDVLKPNVQVQKEVTVENTGDNTAWVWYTIAYPKALDLTDSGKTILWTGFDKDNNYIGSNPASQANQGEWNVIFEGKYLDYYDDEDGTEMVLFTALYQKPLASGQTTPIGLKSVYFDEHIDVDPDGNLAYVKDGVVEDIDWNINENGNPTVYINAYAIQEENFADVYAAYDAYVEQWGELQRENGTTVSTSAELENALESGESVKLAADLTTTSEAKGYGQADIVQNGGVLDGGGNTLSVEGSGDYSAIVTSGGIIQNLTIDYGYRGIFLADLTEDVVLHDVTVGGDGVGYAINTGTMSNGAYKLIATKCTFKGWSSFNGLESASFTNCEFGIGSYYNSWPYDSLVKPYVTTLFKNCTFAEDYYLDLSALNAGCKVTLDNCTVNGTKITANNCNNLFGEVELPSGRTLAECVVFK